MHIPSNFTERVQENYTAVKYYKLRINLAMEVLKYTVVVIVAVLLIYCNAKEDNTTTLTLDGVVVADPSADTCK